MSTQMLRMAAAMMLAAAVIGCGGGDQAAQKPAEQPLVAEVTPMDSMLVASVTKMGPYNEAGKAVAEMVAWLGTAKVQPVGGPFGMYYDDPATVKPESCKYEICIPVAPGTKSDPKANVVVKMLPAMQVASTEHTGPYDKVSVVYQKLGTWITDNKYEAAGPAIEWYLNDPNATPAESLKTRVGMVVKMVEPPPAEEAPQADSGK